MVLVEDLWVGQLLVLLRDVLLLEIILPANEEDVV